MKKTCLFLFISTWAFADNWVKAPSGNPDCTVFYAQKCGADCFQVDAGGIMLDCQTLSVVGGKLQIDPVKVQAKVNRMNAEADAKAQALAKKQARKDKVRQIQSAKDFEELKPLLKDLVDEVLGE